ncbi:MAG: hypothetical protein R6V04_12670 [bacterium]
MKRYRIVPNETTLGNDAQGDQTLQALINRQCRLKCIPGQWQGMSEWRWFAWFSDSQSSTGNRLKEASPLVRSTGS